jgi:hypothetical protein
MATNHENNYINKLRKLELQRFLSITNTIILNKRQIDVHWNILKEAQKEIEIINELLQLNNIMLQKIHSHVPPEPTSSISSINPTNEMQLYEDKLIRMDQLTQRNTELNEELSVCTLKIRGYVINITNLEKEQSELIEEVEISKSKCTIYNEIYFSDDPMPFNTLSTESMNILQT